MAAMRRGAGLGQLVSPGTRQKRPESADPVQRGHAYVTHVGETRSRMTRPISALALPATSATDPLIRFRDVHKSFGRLHVLRGINLEVAEGEEIVVAGASCSGKSTLIRCINRLEPIDRSVRALSARSCHPQAPLRAYSRAP